MYDLRQEGQGMERIFSCLLFLYQRERYEFEIPVNIQMEITRSYEFI
jgi:hypothetical protein